MGIRQRTAAVATWFAGPSRSRTGVGRRPACGRRILLLMGYVFLTAHAASAQTWSAAGTTDRGVVAAVGTEDASSGGLIRQTAGVFEDTGQAIKKGVGKISDGFSSTSPESSDGPTSLAKKPKQTPELYIAVALEHERKKQFALAEQSYQQALKIAPKSVSAILALARFKARQGLIREAVAIYETAQKMHPKEAAVYNDLGLFLAQQRKHAESIAAYEKAVALQPRRPLYRNNIAIVLVETNRADKAFEHLNAVYGEADAYYNTGYLLHKKGDPRAAAEHFAKALQANPGMEEAKIWLAAVQEQAVRVARRETPSIGTDIKSETHLPRVSDWVDPARSATRRPIPQPQRTPPGEEERTAAGRPPVEPQGPMPHEMRDVPDGPEPEDAPLPNPPSPPLPRPTRLPPVEG